MTPVDNPVGSSTFAPMFGTMAETKAAPAVLPTPTGASTPRPAKETEMPYPECTHLPSAAERVALIRSLVGHAEGREEAVLTRVRRVLDGATLDDLLADALKEG